MAKENLKEESDMIFSWNRLESGSESKKQVDHFRANEITQAKQYLVNIYQIKKKITQAT